MRHAVYEKTVNSINVKFKTLKSVSTARWTYQSKIVSSVKANYSSLLIAIDELTNSANQVHMCKRYIRYHIKIFELIFALKC